MTKKFLFLLGILFMGAAVHARQRPKLVVCIVVDQMRSDYLYRYWYNFGAGGFKRLVNEGFVFRNAHYNYIPTYTAPGHASIFTGTTPRFHGIIGNDWYDRERKRVDYCVYDTTVKSVGTDSQDGRMSPARLRCNTIGDEMKLSKNSFGKVIGIAIKDRSAILPAGHAGDGAYWMDGKSGKFISSTWYNNHLPDWLNDFNSDNRAKKMLSKGWSPLYNADRYKASTPDDNAFEQIAAGKNTPTFPYDYKAAIDAQNYSVIRNTPFGNTLTRQLAEACITGESLGADDATDLLCISFSSSDIIAHAFGPNAVETEDTYLRLDQDIENFLNFLDENVGRGKYMVTLTADHGGSGATSYLADHKIPTGNAYEQWVLKDVKEILRNKYNDSTLVASVSNEQIFFDRQKVSAKGVSLREVCETVMAGIQNKPYLGEIYLASDIASGGFPSRDMKQLLQNGQQQGVSGDLLLIYRPNWQDHEPRGTTHGTGYNHDTHVPMIFFGAGIHPGESFQYVTITQLAPTICEWINVSQPSCCSSDPLSALLEQK